MAGLRLPDRPKSHGPDSSLAIVNIVLLLIFFFLATGTLLTSRSVEVALPETTRLPLDLLPQPLLTVSIDGDMTLDGEPMPQGRLAEALIDDPVLHVLADRELSATELLRLIEAENLIAVETRLVTIHTNRGPDP